MKNSFALGYLETSYFQTIYNIALFLGGGEYFHYHPALFYLSAMGICINILFLLPQNIMSFVYILTGYLFYYIGSMDRVSE